MKITGGPINPAPRLSKDGRFLHTVEIAPISIIYAAVAIGVCWWIGRTLVLHQPEPK